MSTIFMVETQIKPRGIVNAEVLRAMRSVPRDLFVPDEYRDFAFSDCPLPLSDGQTISQPYMVAAMTEYLQIDKTSRVLEIGTGCGYQTAILAEIAAQVYTVEIIATLGEGAALRLASLGYDNIHFRIGDGFFGCRQRQTLGLQLITLPCQRKHALLQLFEKIGEIPFAVGHGGARPLDQIRGHAQAAGNGQPGGFTGCAQP